MSQGVALKRQLYGGGGKERIKYVIKHMLANGRQHLQLTQNNNFKFYTSEAAQPQGQRLLKALHSYHKPFNPIQHSLNHMDYKQTLSAAHMTSDIITQLQYTDLWYKSSHRQCTKELPWIYLSKGKDLILGEAHGCSEP